MKAKAFPAGFTHIIANETAERFSYYGMKAILIIYMTHSLRAADGTLDVMDEASAKSWYHLFASANYLFPLLGSVLADVFWGKYKTIIRLSIVYCLGHLVLALFEDRSGLFWGLTLIAIGSGGIKPCVAAHLGDQFSRESGQAVSRAYAWFYLAINTGAFISTLLTPLLLEHYGSHVAFGLPGILMLLATIIFWNGRTRYRALPPTPLTQYWQALKSRESVSAIKSLAFLYFFVAFFWSLFDQTGSTWVLQLEKMDRIVSLGTMQIEILPSQLQALNPILILLLIPCCTTILYPVAEKFIQVTSLRKITTGMALSGFSFLILAFTEQRILMGSTPSILWQALAYGILTLAEVLVSITALEFAYTQAPLGLKSLFGSFYLVSISLGNFITAALSYLTDSVFKLDGVQYFLFFALLPMIAALLLALWGSRYVEQNYLHGN